MVITITNAEMVKGIINSPTGDPVCLAAMKGSVIRGRDGKMHTRTGVLDPRIGQKWFFWTDPETKVRLKTLLTRDLIMLRRKMQYTERHEVLPKEGSVTIYLGVGVKCDD